MYFEINIFVNGSGRPYESAVGQPISSVSVLLALPIG